MATSETIGASARIRKARAQDLLTFEHQGCPQFEPETDETEDPLEAETPPDSSVAPPRIADEPPASRPLKKLKVDLEELVMALEGSGPDQIHHFLDTETGEIIPLFEDADDYEEWCEKIDAAELSRYREIDKLASHQSFEVMEQFALSLPESRDRRALLDALSRNKPFRHFKDAVHRDLALRDEWFAFRDRAYAALARDWLEGEGIEPEWIDPRRRA